MQCPGIVTACFYLQSGFGFLSEISLISAVNNLAEKEKSASLLLVTVRISRFLINLNF